MGPRFWPSLMPEMTRSGGSSASTTSSPWFTRVARLAGDGDRFAAARRGRAEAVAPPGVVLSPDPLWFSAGATMTSSSLGSARQRLDQGVDAGGGDTVVVGHEHRQRLGRACWSSSSPRGAGRRGRLRRGVVVIVVAARRRRERARRAPPPSTDASPVSVPQVTLDGLLDDARSLLDDTVELRRRIHRHPELGLELPRHPGGGARLARRTAPDVRPARPRPASIAVLDGDAPGPDRAAARRHGRAADARGHRARLRQRGRRRDARLRARRPRRHARGRRPPAGGPPGRPRRAGRLHVPAGRGGLRRRQVMLDEGLLDHVAAGAEPVSMAFAIHQTPSSRRA